MIINDVLSISVSKMGYINIWKTTYTQVHIHLFRDFCNLSNHTRDRSDIQEMQNDITLNMMQEVLHFVNPEN